MDLEHMLTVSEAITRSALERRESRGAQFREDHPEKDPESAKFNIVLRKAPDGTMDLERRPIAPMPAELSAIIAEMK